MSSVTETWVKVDGTVYKLWDDVVMGKWPEAEAPIVFVVSRTPPWEKDEA